MEKLIVITSLGRVRPLKFQKTDDDPLQPEHLVEEPDSLVEIKHEPLRSIVTDQAGRFSKSGPTGRRAGMSYGEDHNLRSDIESKALRRVADNVAKIVAREGHPDWRLIAPQAIMPELLRVLPAAARQSLAKSENGDLTKLPIGELEKRFISNNS